MKLIFLGMQGSGKSTQAKIVADRFKLPYIEMGQLFREKAKENDKTGKLVRESIEKGNLVPDEIAQATLVDRTSQSDCERGYVLDGFPRNNAQFNVLADDIDKVFYIKVSDDEAIGRLKLRARPDDTRDALVRRIDIYHLNTEPLLKNFEKRGILEKVDGERKVEEIAIDIGKRLKNFKN